MKKRNMADPLHTEECHAAQNTRERQRQLRGELLTDSRSSSISQQLINRGEGLSITCVSYVCVYVCVCGGLYARQKLDKIDKMESSTYARSTGSSVSLNLQPKDSHTSYGHATHPTITYRIKKATRGSVLFDTCSEAQRRKEQSENGRYGRIRDRTDLGNGNFVGTFIPAAQKRQIITITYDQAPRPSREKLTVVLKLHI